MYSYTIFDNRNYVASFLTTPKIAQTKLEYFEKMYNKVVENPHIHTLQTERLLLN